MNKLIQPTPKIIGESFFHQISKDAILLEKDFVRMDKSIIWKCSEIFWKYFSEWEKMYGEDFESSLPSGISESHRSEFIKKSAENFLLLLQKLKKEKRLPTKIFAYEQGPGTGIFAKGFLDHMKTLDEITYKKMMYIMTDTSETILDECKKTLTDHKDRTVYFEQEEFENLHEFDGQILFVRHSNIWDGWPCRYIQVRKSGLGEVYIRAIIDKKFQDLVDEIYIRGLETSLLNNKEQWKEFFRSIKLQKRTIPVDKIDIQEDMYLQHLSETASDHIGYNTLLSECIEQNLYFLNRLIDWDLGGYAEIVDIVTQEPRTIYPKKFDGSIGYIVDGHIIQTWAKNNNKTVTFNPIRKLNTIVTIVKEDLTSTLIDLVSKASFEIFPTKKLIENDIEFVPGSHTAITCTSSKGEQYTIDAAIELKRKGLAAYPHIIARTIKDKKMLKDLSAQLLANNIHEVFIAAGDTDEIAGEFASSLDVLNEYDKTDFPFKTLAITGYPEGHTKISKDKLFEVLSDKQKFIDKHKIEGRVISQLCFDADTIVRWAHGLQKMGIITPIFIGIAGPCNVLQLMQFSIKCGVGESVKFLSSKKTLGGNILKNVLGTYTPDKLINDIFEHPLFSSTNIAGFHFYTFNNVKGIVNWQNEYLKTLKREEDLIAEKHN